MRHEARALSTARGETHSCAWREMAWPTSSRSGLSLTIFSTRICVYFCSCSMSVSKLASRIAVACARANSTLPASKSTRGLAHARGMFLCTSCLRKTTPST